MLIVMNGRTVTKLGGQDRRWLTVSNLISQKIKTKILINESYSKVAKASDIGLTGSYIVVKESNFKYWSYVSQWFVILWHGIFESHVHFAGNSLEMTPAAVLLRVLGKRISFSFNGVSTLYLRNNRQWKTYVLLKIMARLCCRVEVLNETVLLEGFFNTGKVFLSNAMYAGKAKIISSKTPKKIVFAGHLYLLKGIKTLLKLVQSNPNAEYNFYIYGEMPESGSIQEKEIVNELMSSRNVFLMGHADDMSHAYSDAVVTLSLQTISNYPSQVVLEALSSGCSVIVRDTGDSRRFGVGNGIYYVPDDFDGEKYWEAISDAEQASLTDSEAIGLHALTEFGADRYVNNLIKNLEC